MVRVLIAMLCFSVSCNGVADSMATGKQLADEKTSLLSTTAAREQHMPVWYQGAKVQEAGMLKSGADLETQASEKVAIDPAAHAIYQQNARRPRMVFDPKTDPTVLQAQANADSVSQFIEQGRNGCVALTSKGERNQGIRRQCEVQGQQTREDFICTDTAIAHCRNEDVSNIVPLPKQHFRIVSSSLPILLEYPAEGSFLLTTGKRPQNCQFYNDTIEFDIPRGYQLYRLDYQVHYWDDWLFLTLNNQPRPNTPNAWWTYGLVGSVKDVTAISPWWPCETKFRSATGLVVNLMPHATLSGSNHIDLKNRVGGSGRYQIEFTVLIQRQCEVAYSNEHRCTGQHTDRDLDARQTRQAYCSDNSPITRAIAGTSFTTSRSCWQTTTHWQTWNAPTFTENANCTALRKSGCQQMNSGVCQRMHDRGFCESATVDFLCAQTSAGKAVNFCATELTCQNGECMEEYNQPYDATRDFQSSAAMLAMVEDADAQLDREAMRVWSGKVLSCKKTSFGVKDCCRDSGWGLDIGVTSCSADEIELGQAKEAGKTLYVGSRDGGSWPDEYTKKRYCVYPSKLARVVMQQAISLLGENFGGYNSPNCRGLLLDEFSILDFAQIDLSAYFADVMAKAGKSMQDMPSNEELLGRIRQNLEAIQP